MSKIDTRNWNNFIIKDIFDVKRPVARSQANYEDGDIAFVASGNYNNGVLKYLSPQKNEELDKGNCITVSPIDGSSFYQEKNFLGRGGAGSSVILLYNNNLNLYNGYFIATVIRVVCSKYMYSDMANKDTISEEKIKLPVDATGKPDFAYMELYMRNLEATVSASLTKLQSAKQSKICNIDVSTWGEFEIGKIFPNIIKPVVYHTREVKQDKMGIPYVVRSKFNNGIKYRVKKPNGKINPAKVISFGAENATFFYQKFEWISGRDIYYIDTSNISEYACLFITACLQPIAVIYSYNFGLFPDQLRKEKIKLPIQANGYPDYDFMDSYMKKIDLKSQLAINALCTI